MFQTHVTSKQHQSASLFSVASVQRELIHPALFMAGSGLVQT
jgi:hypothetical protein